MKLVICSLVVFTISLILSVESKGMKSICYYESWAVYRPGNGRFGIDKINAKKCSHLIYTFLGATRQGGVKLLDPNIQPKDFPKLMELKKQNPRLKVMIAMGGWNEGSTVYSAIAGSPALRSQFANNVNNFLNQHHFDGFDLDWEYPARRGGSPADKQNLVLLLKELKSKMGHKKLSIAVGGSYDFFRDAYDGHGINQYVDFVNVMTYDFHTSYEPKVAHHSPLYASAADITPQAKKMNIDAAMKSWMNSGVNPKKLMMGVGFYAHTYTLQNEQHHAIGSPAVGPGMAGPYTRQAGILSLKEINEKLAEGNWQTVMDSHTQTPYSHKGKQWIGYDNKQSIHKKLRYIINKGLGGVMVWAVDMDDKILNFMDEVNENENENYDESIEIEDNNIDNNYLMNRNVLFMH